MAMNASMIAGIASPESFNPYDRRISTVSDDQRQPSVGTRATAATNGHGGRSQRATAAASTTTMSTR